MRIGEGLFRPMHQLTHQFDIYWMNLGQCPCLVADAGLCMWSEHRPETVKALGGGWILFLQPEQDA